MFRHKHEIVEELSETEMENRVAFDQQCREKLEKNHNFWKHIIFFDRCGFTSHGAVNKQNDKICGAQRRGNFYESRLGSYILTVCCTIFEKSYRPLLVKTVILLQADRNDCYGKFFFSSLSIPHPT